MIKWQGKGEEIIDLLNQGFTYNDIAELFTERWGVKVTRNMIAGAVDRMGKKVVKIAPVVPPKAVHKVYKPSRLLMYGWR